MNFSGIFHNFRKFPKLFQFVVVVFDSFPINFPAFFSTIFSFFQFYLKFLEIVQVFHKKMNFSEIYKNFQNFSLPICYCYFWQFSNMFSCLFFNNIQFFQFYFKFFEIVRVFQNFPKRWKWIFPEFFRNFPEFSKIFLKSKLNAKFFNWIGDFESKPLDKIGWNEIFEEICSVYFARYLIVKLFRRLFESMNDSNKPSLIVDWIE